MDSDVAETKSYLLLQTNHTAVYQKSILPKFFVKFFEKV